MEEPEHQQSEWKRQDKSTRQSVAESALGSEAKKILEVGREGAYHQAGSYEVEASKREGSGTVCKGKWHLHIMNHLASSTACR